MSSGVAFCIAPPLGGLLVIDSDSFATQNGRVSTGLVVNRCAVAMSPKGNLRGT